MLWDHQTFRPAAVCDHCGREAGADGIIVWPAGGRPAETPIVSVLVACGQDCAEELLDAAGTEAEWAATALDAYLASLVDALDLDVRAIVARERAAWAALHTLEQAPD